MKPVFAPPSVGAQRSQSTDRAFRLSFSGKMLTFIEYRPILSGGRVTGYPKIGGRGGEGLRRVNGWYAAEADLHIQCGKGYYRLRLDGDHFFRLPFEQPLQASTYCMTYRSISALGRGESVVCVDGLDLFEMLDWNIALS